MGNSVDGSVVGGRGLSDGSGVFKVARMMRGGFERLGVIAVSGMVAVGEATGGSCVLCMFRSVVEMPHNATNRRPRIRTVTAANCVNLRWNGCGGGAAGFGGGGGGGGRDDDGRGGGGRRGVVPGGIGGGDGVAAGVGFHGRGREPPKLSVSFASFGVRGEAFAALSSQHRSYSALLIGSTSV